MLSLSLPGDEKRTKRGIANQVSESGASLTASRQEAFRSSINLIPNLDQYVVRKLISGTESISPFATALNTHAIYLESCTNS